MKAIVYDKYGPPEVVRLTEIPRPQPKENEVLVKVFASTISRTDSGFRSAEYFISRFWSGIFSPKYPVLGCEFSGIIEATGPKTSLFKTGDKVFGYNDKTFGGHAQYLVINEMAALALLPENLNFSEAAALTEGSHYALNNIRAAKVKSGDEVLVYGATGAIGSAAVQLLKHFGANVTAVCDTARLEMVKSLGADTVIDYQRQDFTKLETKFQFIFDAVGKSSFAQCKPLLNNEGVYISTELGRYGVNIFLAMFTPFLSKKKVLFPIPTITKEDVLFLKRLAEDGEFKPVIDRVFTFDEIVKGYQYVESGQKTGNVILRVNEESETNLRKSER